VLPNIDSGAIANDVLAPKNCSKQLEHAFCDPVQRDEWLTLLELQRRLELMDDDSEDYKSSPDGW
jgi:hypothetical protein